MLSRRDFLSQAWAVGAGGLALGARAQLAAPEGRRPNIVWIISEDTSPDFGCYGNPDARTPVLDRLAAEGVRFTHAYTTAPVCSASRSAFMTGMYQTTIGAHNHRSHRDDGFALPDGVHVFTHYLRNAGYAAVIPAGRKTDWNFSPGPEKPYDFNRWEDLPTHQPFFAQIQFSLTHRGNAWKKAAADPAFQVDPATVQLPPYYPDHPVARKDWADYMAAINALDAEIAAALKRLQDLGVMDNTVVFYFGDHGRPHVRGKQWLYEGGIRIPLIVRWPGGLPAGAVSNELVSAIDLAPTSLALAGADAPRHMQGRVFLGPHAALPPQYVFAARDRCDETLDRIRCVRDSRFKYIRNFMPERPYTQPNRYKETQYPVLALLGQLHAEGKLTPEQTRFMAPAKPVEEFYDLQADPHELHNLAPDPEYREPLTRMRGELDAWIIRTNDQGRFPESESQIPPA